LRTLTMEQKSDWKKHLPKLVFAYNSTVHKTTGYSPFYLLFGRNSTLPVDHMFPGTTTSTGSHSYQEFVKTWQSSLVKAYETVDKHVNRSAVTSKHRYDKRRSKHCNELSVGDRVLVRNVRERGGTGKLRNHWENAVFEIVEKKVDILVYAIRNLNNLRDIRTVHRNLLLFCEHDFPFPVETPKIKPTVKDSTPANEPLIVDDEDNDDFVVFYKAKAPSLGGGKDPVVWVSNQEEGDLENVPVPVPENSDVPVSVPGHGISENDKTPELRRSKRIRKRPSVLDL